MIGKITGECHMGNTAERLTFTSRAAETAPRLNNRSLSGEAAGMAIRSTASSNLTNGHFVDTYRLGTPSAEYRQPKTREDYDPLAWQADSLCAQTDPDAFFPEKGGSTRDAKKICTGCEVRTTCLEYALENDERFGIWGGLSERERRKLRKSA